VIVVGAGVAGSSAAFNIATALQNKGTVLLLEQVSLLDVALVLSGRDLAS